MHIRSSVFFLAFLLGAVVVPPTYGQQADTTQLPEIAPREIEIRGERQIALPALERQPLTGFASAPTVPAVPPTHRPYVGPYKQELDDLPEGLPVPETVTDSFQPASNPARGFAEGGAGRYFSRFFEGRLLLPVTPHDLFSVHGQYTGTQGFTPFADESIETPSDVAEARVRFASVRDALRVDADLHGSAQRYTLYGATPAPQRRVSPDPDREAFSGGTTLRLTGRGSVPARAEVRYDHTQYTSQLAAAGSRRDLDFTQDQFRLRGSATAPIALRPTAEVAYQRSWLGGDALTDTGYSLDLGGHLTVLQSSASSVEIGANVFTFETLAQPSGTTPTRVGDTYVAPTLDAEWRATDGLTLHLRNRPRLEAASLSHLYAENPYATHAPSLRPTIETTNAEAGLTFARGPVRVVAGAGFRYAPTYRSFEPGPQGNYADGIFRVRYDAARIIEGRGQIALQGVEGVQASLGLSVRDGTLVSPDTAIPNFATVTGDAMFSVSFAGGDAYFEALGRFEGGRYATTAETNRLDPYLTVDLEGSYALSSGIELLVRAENLAPEAPTRWVGYPRPPAQVSAGFRLQW